MITMGENLQQTSLYKTGTAKEADLMPRVSQLNSLSQRDVRDIKNRYDLSDMI